MSKFESSLDKEFSFRSHHEKAPLLPLGIVKGDTEPIEDFGISKIQKLFQFPEKAEQPKVVTQHRKMTREQKIVVMLYGPSDPLQDFVMKG